MSEYRSYAEYLSHPKYLAVKQMAIKRSQGMCEYAKCCNSVTEVHHVRYCKWGEFDAPENLLAVCNDCHEKIHTCPSCGGVRKSDSIKYGWALCGKCFISSFD